MNPDEHVTLRHNLIFNLLDGASFGFGLGFASFTTILPLFISTMTNSALLIGLIPAIHNVFWQLPQLLTAKRIGRLERFKTWVMFMTINERLPFLGFAVIALLIPKIGVNTSLLLVFILLIWQGLGAGFTANAWQNMLTKVIPADGLTTFLGVQTAFSNLMGGISAFLAGIALTRVPEKYNYSLVFVAAFVFFTLSWIFLNQTREPIRLINREEVAPLPMTHAIKRILREDSAFRNFVISRFLGQFGMMAFAFYTVYAVEVLGVGTLTIGILTSVLFVTQTVFNPILGWLADRWSRKWILVFGGISNILSVLLAVLIHDGTWFALPFILFGIANTAYWTIGIAFTLEFGRREEKPTYVGMSNSLVAPATIAAPLLGGVLADAFGYPVTFYVSIAFALLTLPWLVLLAREDEKK